MTIILGIIGLLLMIYLFWFYLRGRIMNSLIYQGLFFLFILLLLAVPLGWYIKEIMQGKSLKEYPSYSQ